MQLSVVIVNYNVRVFLENALTSVFRAMEKIDGEVFVVDNASDDGSVEMVRQKFPRVNLVVNGRNLGFAAANNRALLKCRGKFILLLNPDTLMQEDTFQVMLRYLEETPEVGMAGCRILNPDGSLEPACRRSFPTPWVAFTKIAGLGALFPHSKLFGRYNLTYLDPDQTYAVEAISGSFMILRREVYEQVGGLDEQFFMYGEDLDWCYRIRDAGWKIAYVHETQIIHYKGESTRRSDIDEVKLFYQAMRLFVKKHFARGIFSDVVLRTGIGLREGLAFLRTLLPPMRAVFLDILFIDCSIILGVYVWFGEFLRFPPQSYPVVMSVPALAMICVLWSLGVYAQRKLAVGRVAGGTLLGFIVISALTFFFKQYAYSRMVVIISGAINLILLPGWRIAGRALFQSGGQRRKTLFGRRTVIVGAEHSGQEVLRKLRSRVEGGYQIVGFVDTSRRRIGEKISGVEILGSIDNIGRIIEEYRASEVIFSTDILSYSDILSIIARTRRPSVNFRLVPSSMEVIIGKAHIDELDDIPLVDIQYNIEKPGHRFLKRAFDLLAGLTLFILFYPVALFRSRSGKEIGEFSRGILELPDVLRGTRSLVGPEYIPSERASDGSDSAPGFLGLPGITGLVQINFRDDLSPDEVEKYNLYYAKNQSLMLDIEILVKSLILLFKK